MGDDTRAYKGVAEVDLSKHLQLRIRVGYQSGGSGEGSAGDGGASTAILDSGGEVVAHVGGGNGDDSVTRYEYGNPAEWDDGGLGGGPNGITVNGTSATKISSSQQSSSGKVILFSDTSG